MTRRGCLRHIAIAVGFPALVRIRVGAARQRIDELCDEHGDCLASENGARLICE